jgi:hypothetical protein
VHKFLGKCYMRAGRTREANDNYKQYLELAPNAADAPFVKSMIRVMRPASVRRRCGIIASAALCRRVRGSTRTRSRRGLHLRPARAIPLCGNDHNGQPMTCFRTASWDGADFCAP